MLHRLAMAAALAASLAACATHEPPAASSRRVDVFGAPVAHSGPRGAGTRDLF